MEMLKQFQDNPEMMNGMFKRKSSHSTFNQILLDLEKDKNLGQKVRDNVDFPESTLFTTKLDELNLKAEGPQLLQASIYCGKPEFVRMLIKKNVDLTKPPKKVGPIGVDYEVESNYIETPYVLQAAAAGNVDTMKELLKAGLDLTPCAPIGLSRARRN